jgi:uncharacterized protein (TIGR02246 family)
MDREAIKALVDRAYQARDKDDVEATLALFHPDAQFQIAGSQDHAKAAMTVQGHQQFREASAGLVATFQFVERTFLSTLIDGDRAAVHTRAKLRFVPNDRTVLPTFSTCSDLRTVKSSN